jgi:hypothetical protein
MTDTSDVTHGQNDQRWKDLLAKTSEIARTHGEGERALPVFAGYVLKAAQDGVIDSDANKHGKGISDGKVLYEKYLKSFSAKAGEHSKRGKAANTSKLNSFIKVGELVSTLGDPFAELGRMHNVWRAQQDIDPQSVKSEYTVLLDWAKAQRENSDGPLADEHLKAIAMKSVPDEKTVADMVQHAMDILEDVITGDKGPRDQDAKITGAHEMLREYLALVAVAQAKSELVAKAAELGFELNALVA